MKDLFINEYFVVITSLRNRFVVLLAPHLCSPILDSHLSHTLTPKIITAAVLDQGSLRLNLRKLSRLRIALVPFIMFETAGLSQFYLMLGI